MSGIHWLKSIPHPMPFRSFGCDSLKILISTHFPLQLQYLHAHCSHVATRLWLRIFLSLTNHCISVSLSCQREEKMRYSWKKKKMGSTVTNLRWMWIVQNSVGMKIILRHKRNRVSCTNSWNHASAIACKVTETKVHSLRERERKNKTESTLMSLIFFSTHKINLRNILRNYNGVDW